MSKKKSEDQRSPDQDTALEQAFVAGTLPEEDRRDAKGDLPINPPKPDRPEGPPDFGIEVPGVPDNTLPEPEPPPPEINNSLPGVENPLQKLVLAAGVALDLKDAHIKALEAKLAEPDFVPCDHEGLPL